MKKKIIYTALCCCFAVAAVAFISTTMKSGRDRVAAGLSRMTNPMSEVQSSEDFSRIGVILNEPENAENVKCFIVANQFAEIMCDIDGQPFVFRAQKGADGKELSGLYGDWISSNRASKAEYYKVNTGEDNYVAIWQQDGVTYVVSTTASEEKLAEIVEPRIK